MQVLLWPWIWRDSWTNIRYIHIRRVSPSTQTSFQIQSWTSFLKLCKGTSYVPHLPMLKIFVVDNPTLKRVTTLTGLLINLCAITICISFINLARLIEWEWSRGPNLFLFFPLFQSKVTNRLFFQTNKYIKLLLRNNYFSQGRLLLHLN